MLRKQVQVCLLVCHSLSPLSHHHQGKKTPPTEDSVKLPRLAPTGLLWRTEPLCRGLGLQVLGLGSGAGGNRENARDSFSHLRTAEMRLWQFSHCLSVFFWSPHCLKSDLARKTLIPELVSVSLQGAVTLLTKGFGRLVDGDKHWGKETVQGMAIWKGNQLRGMLTGFTSTYSLSILSCPPEPTGSVWMF